MNNQATISPLSEFVKQLRSDGCNYDDILKEIGAQKAVFQHNGDEVKANKLWSYEILVDVHQLFSIMFNELQEKKYYDAWCTAEQIDINIKLLRKNDTEAYGYVRDLEIFLPNLQTRYPYKLFMSTVFEIKKEVCTICGQPVNLRKPCGHIAGRVYNGKLCQHRVEKFNLLGADVVANPEHKYAVLFPQFGNRQIDLYDYTPVAFFIRNWKKPFDIR